jgi:excisionase family DNA binding protein
MATATVSSGELLTRKQAAEFLGVQPNTLCTWAGTRRHCIPIVRIGRTVRYRRSDLERFVVEHIDGEFSADD